MKIFEFMQFADGFEIVLFNFFGIGIGGALHPDDGDAPFTTLILRIGKLNSIISLEWRQNADDY
tara:strand:+ start:275 stop:466 length:192 start_codon:yes stop_codon:yes gene_type:complete